MEEILEEIIVPQRVNDFCVIRKEKWGEYPHHDIQTCSGWSANPYGEEYAVVPDSMVTDIKATSGFCDIELNEDGTEVVNFTALPIPEMPEETTENEPSIEEILNALLGV